MTSSLKRIIVITAAVRVASLVVILAGPAIVPFSVPHHDANFAYPFGEKVGFLSSLKTWDANHYLFLAEQGYRPFHISNAFYPLLPALMRVASVVTFGSSLAAGLLVSNLLAVVAVAVVFLLVTRTHDEEVATTACILLLAFPTAFFLGLVYTESLFLALSAGTLLLIRSGRPFGAAVLAILLPLSRPTGVLVAVPVGVALALAWRRGELRGVARLAAVPAGFAVGIVIYLAVMQHGTGDPLAGFDAQRVFLADNSLARLLHPIDWFVENFIQVDASLHGFRTSVLNRLCFLAFVPVAVLSVRRLPPDLLVLALVLGTIPAMTGSLTSYPRYVLMAFPIFVTLALLLRRGLGFRGFVAASAAVQVVAMLVHASNRWVA